MTSGTKSLSVRSLFLLRGKAKEYAASYKLLFAIMLAACVIRVAWWVTQGPLISIDASEYLCAARNLLRGNGYVGCWAGPELMYNPLFAVLIAAFSPITGNLELAAHLVCILSGALLILPVFFIARSVYGTRAAHVSALLIAFHPVLIKLSGSTYTEAIYLTLFMAGTFWGMRALTTERDIKYYALTGICFALAYLTRPEAFAYPVFFALAILIVGLLKKRFRPAIIGSALVLGSFLAVAFPYLIYIYAHSGHVRFEGKWDINYTIGNRIQHGMSYLDAAYGFNGDLNSSGPLLIPSRFAAYTPFPHSLLDKARYMTHEAISNRFDVYKSLSSYTLGDPVIFVLLIVALFRKAWTPVRFLQESVLLTMALSILILMFTAQHVEGRYAYPLIPLLLIWAAKGIDEVGQWTNGLIRGLRRSFAYLPWSIRPVTQTVVALMVILLSVYGSRALSEFTVERAVHERVKDAAVWLKSYSPGRKRVATWESRVAWYSDGTFIQFPDADEVDTLRYLDSQHPDFIYLDAVEDREVPTIERWALNGIPDSRARLVYRAKGPDAGISIYRWLPSTPQPARMIRQAAHRPT